MDVIVRNKPMNIGVGTRGAKAPLMFRKGGLSPPNLLDFKGSY